MKTLKNYFLTGIAAALLVSSCQKDAVDAPVNSLDIKIQATNTSFPVLKSTSALTPAFAWDSGFINVSKIEFEAEKKDSSSQSSTEIHFEWKGPKKVDILGLNSLVGSISLPAGVYHEISLKLLGYQSDAGDSPVFYLSGTYTNAEGSVIPIVLQVNEDIEFRVKQEGFLLDASVDYTSLVHMNLSLLLADVTTGDLDGAALTDGKIIISAESNTEILDKILDNLSDCCEYHFSEGRSEAGDDHGSDSGNDSGSDSGDDHGSNSGHDSGSDSGDDHGSGY
jgi:hypothetical protein